MSRTKGYLIFILAFAAITNFVVSIVCLGEKRKLTLRSVWEGQHYTY